MNMCNDSFAPQTAAAEKAALLQRSVGMLNALRTQYAVSEKSQLSSLVQAVVLSYKNMAAQATARSLSIEEVKAQIVRVHFNTDALFEIGLLAAAHQKQHQVWLHQLHMVCAELHAAMLDECAFWTEVLIQKQAALEALQTLQALTASSAQAHTPGTLMQLIAAIEVLQQYGMYLLTMQTMYELRQLRLRYEAQLRDSESALVSSVCAAFSEIGIAEESSPSAQPRINPSTQSSAVPRNAVAPDLQRGSVLHVAKRAWLQVVHRVGRQHRPT